MIDIDELSERELVNNYIEESYTLNPGARDREDHRRDMADGDQWTERELAVFKKRKEPALVDNVMKDKIDTLIGLDVKLRTDPKAFPRNPGDDDKAEVATKGLRYVADNTMLQNRMTKGLRHMVVEGTEAMFIGIDQKRGDRVQLPDAEGNIQTEIVNNEIDARMIEPDRQIRDPRSREDDYSDARYFGEARWMDLAEAKSEYPDYSEEFEDLFKNSFFDRFKDEPECWSNDDNGKRVLTFQLYYKKGDDWYYCEGFKSKFFRKPELGKFTGEHGATVLPYVVQSSWVKRNGERQGESQRYIDPQKNINKRLSKSLHLMNKNQIVAERGAVDGNLRQIKAEAKKPDGVMVINSGSANKRFEVRDNMDLSIGHLNQLQLALQRFESTGANSALQGNQQASGRSLEIQQEAGSSKLGPVFDAHDQFKTRVYRAIWERIKQFWTAEKWIRVTDENSEEEEAQFVGINTSGIGPNGEPVPENRIAEIDVDIIIDDAPDIVNLQSEQFDNLISLSSSRYGDQIPLKLIIEASNFTNKRAMLEMIEPSESDDPEQQAAIQQQQQMQQALEQMAFKMQELELALKAAEVKETEAQARQRDSEATQTEMETHAAMDFVVQQ